MPPPARGLRRPILIALLLIGSLWFAWRGPVRALNSGSYDFTLIYSSARAWLFEGRPYETETVSRAWTEAGGLPERNPTNARGAGTLVYPPATFPLLAPVAWMPWRLAMTTWTVLGIGMYLASIALLARLAELKGDANLAFWAGAVWFGPASTSIAMGQTAIPALFFVVLGYASTRWGRGGLLGAAASMKPQLGALFCVYEAGRLRVRPVIGAAVVIVALVAAGIARMQAAGTPWWSQWTGNLSVFTTLDDANPSASNPIHWQLINLAYPLHTLTDDRTLVKWAVYGIVGGLCLAFLIGDQKRGRERGDVGRELISLSMVSVVTLLVAYHRSYDAVFLLFPMSLSIRGLFARGPDAGPPRWTSAGVLILLLLFVFPTNAAMAAAAERGLVPGSIAGHAAWRTLLMPHAQWGLLVLCGLLVFMRWTAKPTATPAQPLEP